MYFKLSLKNVRKSFMNYTLYFLTLTFGVCIFYIFNSIDAQKAMMEISSSTSQMMDTLTKLMGVISVFISMILGFLIVYANNFLIRKRKKEIGIYMTLGMEKGKIARILVAETFIIGMLSLGVGLISGIFLSQGLSVITAKLFDADLTRYRFIFSSGAFIKTIVYFGIAFFVVMITSTISISKYKLIDLINAERQNEKQKLKNPIFTVVLFILSIIFIGTAYGLVLKNGIKLFDKRLLFEIILGSIGTFMFFASLSGFFLKFLQSCKNLYFKNLNMFILRQINSRINTAHISMSFICLMLFCTIGILSTGLGISSVLNKNASLSTPYDVSMTSKEEKNIELKMKQYGIDLYKYTDQFVEIPVFEFTKEKLTAKVILDKVKNVKPEVAQGIGRRSDLYLLRLTDYNKLMKLQGKPGISLSENQIAIYSNYSEFTPSLKEVLLRFIEENNTIKIRNVNYEVYPELLTNNIETSMVSEIVIALVVPDEMAEGNKVRLKMLSFNFKGDAKNMENKFESDLLATTNKYKGKKENIEIRILTKDMVKSVTVGTRAVIAFIGIYLGIIFLITSAAILALQQLSEAADNRMRYDILQKVGADDSLINSALFKQIGIYFMLPLALACVHSIVGIKVANDVIKEAGNINATVNIIITALLITAVYGSYFLATYFSSKRIIIKNREYTL